MHCSRCDEAVGLALLHGGVRRRRLVLPDAQRMLERGVGIRAEERGEPPGRFADGLAFLPRLSLHERLGEAQRLLASDRRA